MKKLPKKERADVVTKGHMEDYVEAILDKKFSYYLDAFRDENNEKFEIIFEELRTIRQENGRRIEICENRLDRTEKRLGIF